MSNIRRETSR